MKNTNKKLNSLEQKIYTALIAGGVFVLAAVTVIYGVRTQKSLGLVDQSVQSGEQNPVVGPVAKTATEDTSVEMRTDEKEVEKQMKQSEQVEESMAAVTAYNGKDKLAWPVAGNVIIPYSMDTTVYFETLDQYQCNPALHIKADKGTEVKAVFGGVVSNVTENNRYGNLITIDIGNGYKVTYGQVSDILFKKGDVVKTGSVLGRIAEPTDYFALEGSHLYMKMTLQGKAVNPAEYLES